MEIYVESKKNSREKIAAKYHNSEILDVTSNSEYRGLRELSPFFPHGNIPIPGMKEMTAICVEAVWQGLKVFDGQGVDYKTFENDTMENIKRTVRKYGKPRGHRYGNSLLNYEDARWEIYLPTYLYMLENVKSIRNTIEQMKLKFKDKIIIFLDYNTNCDICDYSKPLSHAYLLKLYIEGNYPKNRQEYKNKFYLNLIKSIECHEKYNKLRHAECIEALHKMIGDGNIVVTKNSLKKLSGKRSGWKSIIEDIYSNKSNKRQTNDASLTQNELPIEWS